VEGKGGEAFGKAYGKGIPGTRHFLCIRTAFFFATRRVERLLIKQPPVSSDSSAVNAPLAPLPTGLLILSMTRLRLYALNYLPSSIREPFLEDLKDPELDTNGKLRIVKRMWRSWGTTGEGVIRP